MVSQSDIIMDIVFSSDDNYSHAVGTAITSILSVRNQNEHFRFYVLDGGISEINKQRLLQCAKNESLTFIEVDNESFRSFSIPEGTHFNLTNYYRLLLPELLPNIDRVLYLDCDIIVCGSLKDLWFFDLKNALLAAARDYSIMKGYSNITDQIDTTNYINSGILLIDLKKWRNENIQKKLIDFACTSTIPLFYVDQDIINIVLKDSIGYLEANWNYLVVYDDHPDLICEARGESNSKHGENDIKIVHYVGNNKPWFPSNRLRRKYKSLYNRVLRNTPWKYNIWKWRWTNFIFRLRAFPKAVLRLRWSAKAKYCIICGVTIFHFAKKDKEAL